MEKKLKLAPEQVIEHAVEAVRLAKGHVDDVEFSAEDAGRSDPAFLAEILGAAVDAGATTVNVPDTVGYMTPWEYGGLIGGLIERVPALRDAVVSVHCHDDLGLAVANSLAGVRAGATQVECTVNGIGERAGNASLEEIVMALHTRRDFWEHETGIDTRELYRSSRMVSMMTGMAVPPNKAVVGDNAFAHEAGIHQDGMLKHHGTYEIMRPEDVGLAKSNLVMGKHSGRHAFKEKLRELGIELGANALQDAFVRFKALADRKKEVWDDDIVALVEEATADAGAERIRLGSLRVVCGTEPPQTAELVLEVDGEERRTTATGDGPVDAAFNAVKELVPHNATLELYQVHAVTEGTDAQAEVTVRLEEGGKTVNGQGAETDTILASARAYVAALNKLLVKREKTAPAALSA
jgi:2-isopropylmalate synthase